MSDVSDLFERIKALSVPDRLRLAAGLLEQGQDDIAAQFVRRTHEEMQLVALRKCMGET